MKTQITAAAMSIAVLSEGIAKADDAGIMAAPAYAYKIQDKSHNSSLRIVGWGKLTEQVSGSGVFDLSSSKKNSANFDSLYSELQLHLFDVAGPMIYYEINAPGEDKARFGSHVAPRIHENLTATLWMMPFTVPTESTGELKSFIGDPKIVAYMELKISETLSADTYWSWGRLDEFVYGEAGVSWMPGPLGIGPQIRQVFSFNGSDSTALLARGLLSF